MRKNSSALQKICSAIFCFTIFDVCAAEPAPVYGIIGGWQGGDSSYYRLYSALVSSQGVVTELSLPTTDLSEIWSVAINSKGNAIIGGYEGNPGYAALVSPTGTVNPLTISPSTYIDAVAINQNDNAIIGGNQGFGVPYLALVSPTGNVTEVGTTAPSGISSVAINSSGNAIIGSDLGYFGLISPTGVLTEGSLGSGLLEIAAINSAGYALLGGRWHRGPWNTNVLGMVDPDGNGTVIRNDKIIYSVALNDSNKGIVGGDGWTALVTLTPSVTTVQLTDLDLYRIGGVAINSSGAAIVAGSNGNPYVGLVSPTGVITEVSLEYQDGESYSAAITESGVGLAGGFRNYSTTNEAWAVLVSPSGVATELTLFPDNRPSGIYSVALALGTPEASSALEELITPKSFGSGFAFTDTVLPFSTVLLPAHCMFRENQKKHIREKKQTASASHPCAQELMATLSESDLGKDSYMGLCERGKIALQDERILSRQKQTSQLDTPWCVWASAFGLNAHHRQQDQMPKISDWGTGALLAADYQFEKEKMSWLLGGGVAYAFNYIDLPHGHEKINQELITIYSAVGAKNLLVDVSLWGGHSSYENKRHFFHFLTAKSKYHGLFLLPHIQINTPIEVKSITISPFAMFDWLNNWQGKVREHGASGIDLRVGRQYCSLLRSEVGMRFFETLSYLWGDFTLQEKVSYVNRKPFGANTTSAFFAGAFSLFPITLFGNKMENLFSTEFQMNFAPSNKKYPYGSIAFHGEYGSRFIYNVVSLEIGKEF